VVARAEARKLLAEFTLGKTSPQVISYKKAVEQFIEEKEKARRKSTANAYKGLLNRLSFEDQVTAIVHEEVARKLQKITTQGAYNHHLIPLKVFFNWCIKRRYRTDNLPVTAMICDPCPCPCLCRCARRISTGYWKAGRHPSGASGSLSWRSCGWPRQASPRLRRASDRPCAPSPLPASAP